MWERGYLAIDAVAPDLRDVEGKTALDKAVEAQDRGFSAARRRNLLGMIRDWVTLGLR